MYSEYNSRDGSGTIYISRLRSVRLRDDIDWMGRVVSSIELFPPLCMGALGVLCAGDPGSNGNCPSGRVLLPPTISSGSSRRSEGDRTTVPLGGRVWRDPGLAATWQTGIPLCDPRAGRRIRGG